MKIQSKIRNKISLPVKRETPACICMHASYTVEAVVIIPLFVAFMVVLLFFFRVLQVQQEVGSALMQTARELSIVSYQRDWLQNSGLAEAKTMLLLHYTNGNGDAYIKGGKMGISLKNSDFSGEYVDLKAEYTMPLPVGFFGIKDISIAQRAKCRKWTGRNSVLETQEKFVYITPYGEAYHGDKNCRYLDLSLQLVEKNQLEKLRNKDDGKYYACSKCVKSVNSKERVYITDYGNRYHNRINCVDLKRTVIAVRISEVGSRHACSGCGRELL